MRAFSAGFARKQRDCSSIVPTRSRSAAGSDAPYAFTSANSTLQNFAESLSAAARGTSCTRTSGFKIS
eukprot:SAG11_NODE_12715_length_688_cov_0.788136_1_plen_67_part_01